MCRAGSCHSDVAHVGADFAPGCGLALAWFMHLTLAALAGFPFSGLWVEHPER